MPVINRPCWRSVAVINTLQPDLVRTGIPLRVLMAFEGLLPWQQWNDRLPVRLEAGGGLMGALAGQGG
jgi:hypothetical protein